MEHNIETIKYSNGEIQRVEIVYLDSFSSLDFYYPEFSKDALVHLRDLYQDYFIKVFPYIFGTYYLYHLPDNYQFNYDSNIKDPYIASKAFLIKNYKNEKGQRLINELTNLGYMYCVKGKNPFITSFMPFKSIGFLSNKDAKFKVNSNFFTFDLREKGSIYDLFGTPIGLCIKNGEVLNPPLFNREALLVYKDKVVIKKVDITDLDINIKGKVYQRPKYKYSPKSSLLDIIVIGNKVVDIKQGGHNLIPISGYIVQSEDSSISIGDNIVYKNVSDILFGLSVGNSVVVNGEKTTKFISPFYKQLSFVPMYPPIAYPMNYQKDRAPRIVLGEKENKPVILFFEGKPKTKYSLGYDSCGASLQEVADYVDQLKITNAIHLDGGGSAQILLKNKRALKMSDRDKNDQELERPIPVGLIVK